jgi:2-oxo-4-hydroxy-4-carboxy-5-ureidoimidazoline decarboxylase
MDAVEIFNSLPAVRLEEDLLACCAAPSWGAAIIAGRPYRERSEIVAVADAAARRLSWDEALVAMSAHPRIGERASGDSREAAWSRREQSTAARTADELTRSALVEANRSYESRFGHVFLIFASGRTQEEILAAARDRLGNDDQTERAIVTDELRKIALRRLEGVLDAFG